MTVVCIQSNTINLFVFKFIFKQCQILQCLLHCPKNNLNLCFKTEPVAAGADATVHVCFWASPIDAFSNRGKLYICSWQAKLCWSEHVERVWSGPPDRGCQRPHGAGSTPDQVWPLYTHQLGRELTALFRWRAALSVQLSANPDGWVEPQGSRLERQQILYPY